MRISSQRLIVFSTSNDTTEEPHGWGWMGANVLSLYHSLQWYAMFHLTSLSFCCPYKGATVIPPSMCCCEDYTQKFILSVFKYYKNLQAFQFNFASDYVATSIFFLSQFGFNRNDCFKHVLLPSHLQGCSSSCVAH